MHLPSCLVVLCLIFNFANVSSQQQGTVFALSKLSCQQLSKLVPGSQTENDIYNKADLLQQQGLVDKAIEVLQGGICSNSVALVNGGLYSSLGVLVKQMRDLTSAIRCYKTAIRLERKVAGHRYRLGNALMEQRDFNVALNWYLAATKLDPKFAEAYNNMGNCLASMSLLQASEKSYEYAVLSSPKSADYMVNLAGMQARKDPEKAIRTYNKSLTLNPRFPEAYNNLANLLREQGDLEGAVSAYTSALKLRPGDGSILTNIQSTMDYLCDWSDRKKNLKELGSITRKELKSGDKPSLSPFYANTFSIEPELLLSISKSYSDHSAALVRYLQPILPKPASIKDSYKNLRIGFVSSDLTSHIVGHGIATLLESMTKSFTKAFCFALTTDGSETRKKIEKLCVTKLIRDLPVDRIAASINEANIHVLIDLNGHTKGNRIEIFAAQAAPVQVLFHGYAGTSGSNFMQHFIADFIAVPPEHSTHFSEKLLLMPHSYFLAEDYSEQFKPSLEDSSVTLPIRNNTKLPAEGFIFACFNNLYKVDAVVFNIWSEILAATPGSVLWMLRLPAAGEKRVMEKAKSKGLESRILFSDLFPRQEHLRWKGIADLFLDTPKYNAHSTAADSFGAGVPVLTLPGPSMTSRVAASLANVMGSPQLIARTKTEYRDIAIRLAKNGGRGAKKIRKFLESKGCCGMDAGENTTELFQMDRWARSFERLLRLAWEAHVSGGGGEKSNINSINNGNQQRAYHVVSSASTTRKINNKVNLAN